MNEVIKRNLVVQRWGTPHETVGSLNEPREWEEHGHVVNEKWIYRSPPDDPRRPRQRIIYWLRYDFVASYLIDRDGHMVREDPRGLLEGLHDRLFRPASASGRV